jgi:chromosomal replication initiation ATPase DnaA
LLSVACTLFAVSEADLLSDSRQVEVVAARRALIKVLMEHVGWSYPRCATLLNKDNSTMVRAHVRANDEYRTDDEFYEAVNRLEQELAR